MIHRILKAAHFIPDDHVDSVYDIDFSAYAENGVTTLLLDLDNTLISYDDTRADDKLSRFLFNLRENGFKIVVISNSRHARLATFCEPLGLDFVSFAKKPFRGGFKKALRIAQSAVSDALFVGDQMMTDVYGAKRMGIRVLLVQPIKKKTEKWYTRFNRRIERKILKRIADMKPDLYRSLRLDERE